MTMTPNINVIEALHQQYDHLEEYCNAQTLTQNALIEDNRKAAQYSHTLQAHLDHLQTSLQHVQSDLKQLQLMQLTHPRLQQLLVTHLERSQRILKTIYHGGGRFHANGIPDGKDDIDAKTVSLACLKASIAEIERKIGDH